MKNKFILGGGIAGLITAFYMKNFAVISPEFGGQFNSHFTLGPRYLHKTPATVKFLKKLDMPVEEFEVKVGYHDGNSYCMPTQDQRKRYFAKSRGGSLDGYNETAMNSNKQKFTALKVDFLVLIEKLKTKIGSNRLIEGKITKITNNQFLETEKGDKFYYEELINTMPLNFLLKAIGNKEICKTHPVTYVLVKKEYLKIEQIANSNYDFIYCFGETCFHRITQEPNKDTVVLDVFGHMAKPEAERIFGEHFVDCYTLWNAQLIEDNAEEIKEVTSMLLDNFQIECIGRYGTHERRWKTETVVEHFEK